MVELIDLPAGQPGHPSRAMTQEQAGRVLRTASGKGMGYVRTVKASKGGYGATHAATEIGELACGTKPHEKAGITEVAQHQPDAAYLQLPALAGPRYGTKPIVMPKSVVV